MVKMRGSQFIAQTLDAYGITHVFLVPVILRETMSELEDLGIEHIITHSEKLLHTWQTAMPGLDSLLECVYHSLLELRT